MRFVLLAFFVLSAFLALLPHLVFLFVKAISFFLHFRVAYKPYGYVAVGLVCLFLMTVLYGNLYGRFLYEVKTLNYQHDAVPQSFRGYRIVQISDLHLDGWKGHEAELQARVEKVNALEADLICFTGDLVSVSPEELRPFIPILRQLKAKDGIVSILGNHDYLPYSRIGHNKQRVEAVQEIIRQEKEALGWQLLLNEHCIIRRGGDSIAILGCENQSVGAHPVIQRGDLTKTMKGTEGLFRILLTHDPSQWRKEVVGHTDIPLTLSGHTHAMQFRILGFTPSKWFYPECDGLYQERDQSLYVNIGLGGTLPMRIGAVPEITLIELQ